MPRLVAVVPVFNEAATVPGVVRRLGKLCPVIVVDDASTDGSGAGAAAAGARVVRLPARGGKGAALRLGFAEALRAGADGVATLDGDGQHDPAELPRLIAAGRRVPEALVVGDRLGGLGDRIPRARLAAIRIADRWLGWLTGMPLRDTQCGFRLYPAVFLRAARLREEGFVLESEALVEAARRGFPLVSVPLRAIYPPGRASRFRGLADGLRIGRYLAREVVREAARRIAVEPRGRRVRVAWPLPDARGGGG
ncbi:MAG TPA: glycosyltransferase family 2 protein [Methylomirabilota bacterium]|jgi:glycosyltransferase involved in cell wall biosynthesis|nr:glycosyltransferase family 2 protein [Methylomirabilota bacterium]